MPKTITPSFTHELKLITNNYQERKLSIKFMALKELYNTILGIGFKRLREMKKDPIYKQVIADYIINKKLEHKKDVLIQEKFKKEQKRLFNIFNQLNKQYGFEQYLFQKIATETKNNTYMKDHLDGDTIQVISDRAFKALSDWRYRLRGKPRFKSWKEGIRSISGKKNSCVSFKKGKVKWKDLTFKVIFDHKDKHGIETHALNSKIKYCRIVSRKIKGKVFYYLQLVLEGIPKTKFTAPKKTVGIDVGVSTIAAFSDNKALLEPFCLELNNNQKEIKRIQRLLSRSLLLNNPQNYNEKGAIIKGKKTWIKSNNYNELHSKLLELYRLQKDKRHYLHNILSNEVLKLGCNINIEKNNYKAWQKGWFGKTIGFRAPSAFVTTLKRKALSAGGTWFDINSFQAKLSQLCHDCGQYHRKLLSDRIHKCCDINMQRDLYSALLAHYTNEENEVNIDQLKLNWSGVDEIQNNAILTLINKLNRIGKGQTLPASLGIKTKVKTPELESSH